MGAVDDNTQPRADLYPTGRKLCSRCGTWRPLVDYGILRNGKARGQMRTRCLTCERIVGRVANPRKRGKETIYRGPEERTCCKEGHEWTEGNTYLHRRKDGRVVRQCRTCNSRRSKTPEVMERRRAYQREWDVIRRRKAGIPPRSFSKPKEIPEERVPGGPFRDWLYRRMEIHQCSAAELEARFGMKKREIYQFLGKAPKTVPLEIVDRLLTHEDDTMLWELYPGLYEEE